MRNRLVLAVIISASIYLITSTMNYNLDYEMQELIDKQEIYEQKIDENLVEERVYLSREQAVAEYALEFNNNWYYLKEDDE